MRGMKPYSRDLRLKVLDAVDHRMPRQQLAKVFGVAVPTNQALALRRPRQSGDLEPKPIPGPPARKKGALLEGWLPSQLRDNPPTSPCRSTAKCSRKSTPRRSRPPP